MSASACRPSQPKLPQTMTGDATQCIRKALGIPELLEMILSYVDPNALAKTRRVAKEWQDNIDTSPTLRRFLFLEDNGICEYISWDPSRQLPIPYRPAPGGYPALIRTCRAIATDDDSNDADEESNKNGEVSHDADEAPIDIDEDSNDSEEEPHENDSAAKSDFSSNTSSPSRQPGQLITTLHPFLQPHRDADSKDEDDNLDWSPTFFLTFSRTIPPSSSSTTNGKKSTGATNT